MPNHHDAGDPGGSRQKSHATVHREEQPARRVLLDPIDGQRVEALESGFRRSYRVAGIVGSEVQHPTFIRHPVHAVPVDVDRPEALLCGAEETDPAAQQEQVEPGLGSPDPQLTFAVRQQGHRRSAGAVVARFDRNQGASFQGEDPGIGAHKDPPGRRQGKGAMPSTRPPWERRCFHHAALGHGENREAAGGCEVDLAARGRDVIDGDEGLGADLKLS